MHCSKGNAMSEVWAVIVIVIIALIVYGIVSAKINARTQRLAQERTLPFIQDTLVPDSLYDLSLSDGRKFKAVRLLGTTDPDLRLSPLGEWGAMLVLLQPSGKKAFVRSHSVRCIEEA